ncbi:hypothetical protein [uncultured Hydrogenophaga sp.]|uniref:hypothetical protein n=1 Tax=uncultured Hydrogenophaga sp. TaxID=199683 RepID=UPI00265E0F29|nr:hypothetical protein [uncultured Hydrogenophaga sp.]
MGIRYTKTCAVIEGDVPADDAEALSAWVQGQGRPTVCLKQAGHLHCAVLQVLLAWQPRLRSEPPDPWLRRVMGLSDIPQSAGAHR